MAKDAPPYERVLNTVFSYLREMSKNVNANVVTLLTQAMAYREPGVIWTSLTALNFMNLLGIRNTSVLYHIQKSRYMSSDDFV